jgi:hypothetical protein
MKTNQLKGDILNLQQKFCVFFLVFCSAAGLSAQTTASFTMPSARYAGMGGVHRAYAKDFHSLLINPAALSGMEKTIGFAELSASLYGLDIMTSALDMAQAGFTNDKLSKFLKSTKRLALGADIGGPLSAGLIINGFGIGVFDRIHADIGMKGTNVTVTANADVFLTGGYGFNVLRKESHALDVGATAKIFYRFSVAETIRILSLIDSTEVPLNAVESFGFGFDLGVQYTWAEALTVALVCRDIVSPAFPVQYSLLEGGAKESLESVLLYPDLGIGVAYKVPIPFGDLNLMADYRDFTDLISPAAIVPRNGILNFNFGAEYILFNFLSLRLGLGDMLPSVGLGLRIKKISFDFAVRGKELGLDPGVNPVYVLDMGLLFRK